MINRGKLEWRSSTWIWGQRTYLMGIVNVTPDSFSGDGMLSHPDWIQAAVDQAQAQVEAGADIIDIGGESTRPGSQPVSEQDELDRVIPVIERLAPTLPIPISIDTYKAEVARQAIAAGAELINDVWGLRMDPNMAEVAAATGAAVVIMHNRSRPKDVAQTQQLGGRYIGVDYDDLLADIQTELLDSIQIGFNAGIPADRIIVDPGIGFGKTVEQNLELIDRLAELTRMGYPILVGPSRKSFVGYTLNLPPDQRIEGTSAAVSIAIDRGADLIRVHDVAPIQRVIRITDAIVRRSPAGASDSLGLGS